MGITQLPQLQDLGSVSWNTVTLEQKFSAKVSSGRRKHFCLRQLPVGVGSEVFLQDHKIGSVTIVDGTPNMY